MFLNWYRNFSCLVDDHVGGPREQRFMPLDGITYLQPGRFPTFTKVTDPYDPRRVLQNIWSGYASPADILTGYAAVDLVAERLQPTALLDELSVTGFFHTRPYMTKAAATFHDDLLTLVWGLPSSQAAVSAYQRFMSFNYRRPTPSLWLLRGSSQELLLEPLRRSLESLGGAIELGTEATRLVRRRRRISALELRSTAMRTARHLALAVSGAFNRAPNDAPERRGRGPCDTHVTGFRRLHACESVRDCRDVASEARRSAHSRGVVASGHAHRHGLHPSPARQYRACPCGEPGARTTLPSGAWMPSSLGPSRRRGSAAARLPRALG
jgi:hypothetical protein